FKNPNDAPVIGLPNTDSFFPPKAELISNLNNLPKTFEPKGTDVIFGVPTQEKGVRLARAVPYELEAARAIDASPHTRVLTYVNPGKATVVFHVRSGNASDPVRYYTVEPHKQLAGSWNVGSSYDLSVYGPNGFVRFFKGGIGASAAALDVVSSYDN